MPIYVELRDRNGNVRTGLPDPSAGTFDAAGDFDRFLDRPPYSGLPLLPILASLDPYSETLMPSGVMGQLIADCTRALAVARDGAERRGLERLRVMAEICSHDLDAVLAWVGD